MWHSASSRPGRHGRSGRLRPSGHLRPIGGLLLPIQGAPDLDLAA